VQPDLPSRRINLSKKASVTAKQRPGFIKLIDRIESGDVLVVTKLEGDRSHC
jgi:putative DNA-invertase from lambdoid prophage Rac